MSFNTFYTVVLSSSATLMGLLFFAVLFNADRRGHKLGPRWLSVARSTLNIYIVLLFLPLVLLFPDFDDRLRAAIILALVTFSVVRQFGWWRSTLLVKAVESTEPPAPIVRHLIWLFLAPAGSFALIGHSAIISLLWRVPFHGPRLSIVILILFTLALRNSWDLVFEHAGLTGEIEGDLKREF
jgi:hypothetical protein